MGGYPGLLYDYEIKFKKDFLKKNEFEID